MVAGINESKILYTCKGRCKFDGKNVIEMNGVITINVDVSVKSIMYEKNIFGTLLHAIVKIQTI